MNDKERIVKLVQRRADGLLKCLHECKETMPMGKYLRKQAMYSTCLWLLEKINAMPNIDQKPTEDERIRKAIITFFQRFPYDSIEKAGTNAIEALAWLEKQGECKDTFPIPTRETILSIWELGNDWKDITHGSISTKYGTQLEYIQKHWQESEYYLEKQGEQKPFDYENATITQKDFASKQEWSEEDEKMFDFCCDYLDDNQINWLKSIKDRVKGKEE